MKCITLFAGCLLLGPTTVGTAVAQTKPAEQTTITTSEGDVQVNLPPGTKSVLKRPAADDAPEFRAGYDGGAMVPVPKTRMNDSAVRPASNFTSGAPPAAAANGSANADAANDTAQAAAAAAADLMAQALNSPKEPALAGRPTTLFELMSRVGGDRNRQSWVVRGYWKLMADQADCNWAAEELARLDEITATKGLESSVLSAAQAAAQARFREAQVGAVAAQQELADLLGITDKAQLPVAADPPLVGPYRTYFDTLFAARAAPPRTRGIDRGLPIRLEAIQARTAAVHAASSAVHYAEDARAKGQTDLQTLLNSHADLSRQRRAFLATVRDYNLDIGEYVLAVTDPSTGADRLVAMMILVKPQASAAPATAATAAAPTGPPAATMPSDEALLQPAAPAPAPATDAATRSGDRRTGSAGDRPRN